MPTEPTRAGEPVSSSAALRVLWRSVGRWIALTVACVALFVVTYLAATPLFRSMAYKLGYQSGLGADISPEESEYYSTRTLEGVKFAWRISGVDYDESGGPGWYVAHFFVRAVDTTDLLAKRRKSPKIIVPAFSIQSPAVTGRWYSLSRDGGVSYVER